MGSRGWSESEAEFLRNSASDLSLKELSAHLGRPVGTVSRWLRQLGLRAKDGRAGSAGAPPSVWTPKRLDRLREVASELPAAEIANLLGVTTKQVRTALYDYKIPGRGRGAPRSEESLQSVRDKARIRREAKYPPEGPWVCLTCGVSKLLSDFHDAGSARCDHKCRSCWRSTHILRSYGLTDAKYEEMLAAQGGVCAICHQPETRKRADGELFQLAVDHDHSCCSGRRTCGKCIRGLLCWECNNMIGKIEKHVGDLQVLADYLSR